MSTLSETMTAVPTLHTPPPSDFDAMVAEGSRPVVLTGCLDDWPLFAGLRDAGEVGAQVDLLERLVGSRKVRYTSIAAAQQGHLGYREDGAGTNFRFDSGGTVPFPRFAQALRETVATPDGGAVYMQSVPLPHFPGLLPQVPDLPYLRSGAPAFRQLWIGSGGQVVNLHFDPTHNLIAMLAGTKRVTLVPPDHMGNLYPAPLDMRLGDAIGSMVKVLAPDFSKHPRAAQELAKAQVATLNPGDVLYIPPMWWHHVESFGLNVMINTWVLPVSPDHFTDLTRNVVRGIFAFDDVPPDVRARYRARFQALAAGEAVTVDARAASDGGSLAGERFMRDAAAVLDGVPAALRRSLPQLYDYYVFQTDGPPALSHTNPDGFKRKLRLYAWTMGALRAAQSLVSRRSSRR